MDWRPAPPAAPIEVGFRAIQHGRMSCVQEARWQPLFTLEELEICRRRLKQYGYDKL